MKKAKPYTQMTAKELAAATRQFNEDIPFEATKPLSADEQARWRRARGDSRRKPGKALLIAVERRLLDQSDAFAKKHGMSRSELIAKGLRAVLSGKAG